MNSRRHNEAPSPNGTVVYQRQHRRGLTLPQLNALDLLVTGKTDKQTADLLRLSRTCVTKWRLYDPTFQAALNARRAEVWGSGIDRLRSLIPKALDTLADLLEQGNHPSRIKAACAILRLAPLPDNAAPTGSTDAEEIVRRIVAERRRKTPGTLDFLQDDGKGLPPFAKHIDDVWKELDALANAPDDTGEAI